MSSENTSATPSRSENMSGSDGSERAQPDVTEAVVRALSDPVVLQNVLAKVKEATQDPSTAGPGSGRV